MSRTFNRMTSQLEAQRNALMNANRELDDRRQFTELVLSGVSAGVIGLDAQGRINLPNRPASELLLTDLDTRIGATLEAVAPEMSALLEAADRKSVVEGKSVAVRVDLGGTRIINKNKQNPPNQ